MNKKMILSSVLSLSLLGTAAFALNANGNTGSVAPAVTDSAPAAAPDANTPAAMPKEPSAPYSVGISATVTEVLDDDGQISLEVKRTDGETLILHLSDETILLDAEQAIPVGVESIKAGDEIYAYHAAMMTMSIPAQTPALVILTNVSDGQIAFLHMPEQIQPTANGVELLNDHGSIIVRTDENTVFTPYRTRQIVTADDLHLGQPYLAWYDVVAESYPAQAAATRIMILPAPEEQEVTFVLDGDMVIETKPMDGFVLVPVRTTAEALGNKVGYQKDADGTAYVTIEGKTGVLSLTIGDGCYRFTAAGAKDAEPAYYGAPALITANMSGNQVAWMSAEAFRLLGYTVNLTDYQLSIK